MNSAMQRTHAAIARREAERDPAEIGAGEDRCRCGCERAVEPRQRPLDRPLVAHAADRDRHHGEPDRLHQHPAVAQVAPRAPRVMIPAAISAVRARSTACSIVSISDSVSTRSFLAVGGERERAHEAERRPSGKAQQRGLDGERDDEEPQADERHMGGRRGARAGRRRRRSRPARGRRCRPRPAP